MVATYCTAIYLHGTCHKCHMYTVNFTVFVCVCSRMIFRREQTLLCHVPIVRPFLTLRHDFYSRHPICWKHQTCSILGRRPCLVVPHHSMSDDIYCVQAWTCEGCPQPVTVNVYLPQQPPPPRAASQHRSPWQNVTTRHSSCAGQRLL